MRLDWPSIEAYVADHKSRYGQKNRCAQSDQNWANGLDQQSTYVAALRGCSVTTEAMTDAMSKVDVSNYVQASKPTWVPCVAGARVSVPDFLGGSINCMRRRVKAPKLTRHVKIFVSANCAASISASEMMARGAAILSLVEGLSNSGVQVDLAIVAYNDSPLYDKRDFYQVIGIPQPLDISTASFAIANVAFLRCLLHGYAEDYARSPLEMPKDSLEQRHEALGMGPSDILIPRANGGDPLISQPQVWLTERLDQILGGLSQ